MDITSYLLGKQAGSGGGGGVEDYFVTDLKEVRKSSNAGNELIKEMPAVTINAVNGAGSFFKQMYNLQKINKLSGSVGGDCSSFCESCEKLESVDISGVDISTVKYFQNAFRSCNLLTEVIFGNYNASSVQNTSSMFQYCGSLTEIDLSRITSTSITGTSTMFGYCRALRKIDMRNFIFDNVTNYTNMFGTSSSTGVPDDCLIIVKGDTEKTWITSNFSRLTNVKTVAEYEA